MDDYGILSQVTHFEWDEGNATKNWEKHRVNQAESEQVFFNRPLLLLDDRKHSLSETRYFALGKTNAGRKLLVVFTLRGTAIRVISARDMSQKEHSHYDNA